MLAQTISEAAARLGDHPLFVDADGRCVSATEFDRLTDAAAKHFLDNGVRPDDVIACPLPSDMTYVIAYGGAAKIGAITAGMNPKLSPVEHEAMMAIAQPTYCVSADDMSRIYADEGNWRVAGATERLVQPLAPHDDRIVALVFTSGTSGTPKAAVFAERQLKAIRDLDLGERSDAWGGGQPMFVSTQMAHVGFMTKLPWYIQTGSTLHLLPKWTAQSVLNLVEQHAMPVIGGVAPQIALLLRSPHLDKAKLDTTKMLIVGGAASPVSLVAEAIEAFDAAYSIRYSSTESGGVGLENTITPDRWRSLADDEVESVVNSIGRPRNGVDADVIDEHGRRAADDEIGELILRSPAMMQGYWNNPDATSEAIVDGWLHTGDLAIRSADGTFRLAGRRTEMYIRGGYNVFPAEVENALNTHPSVDQIAIVAVPHEIMGEVGAAVIVPTGTQTPALDELVAYGRNRLAAYKLPEHLFVVPQLPLTAMQKIDKQAIKRYVLDHLHR